MSLYTPVQMSQIEPEMRQLVSLYVDKRPRHVVEIGTHLGGTLYHWLTKAVDGATVVSIDKGKDNWVPAEQNFDNSHWWSDWTPQGVTLYYLEADSQDPKTIETVGVIMRERIDWLFIDGDHSYEGAKADWENYLPMMAEDGVVAFHDLKTPDFSPHIQVGRLWEEIKSAGYDTYEIISKRQYVWGGIGVVQLCK